MKSGTTTQIMTSREAYDRHKSLLNDVISAIKEHIDADKEELIEFNENCFEDEASNDLCAIDKENVYFDGIMESYPLHELGLLDAIKILGDFESGVIGSKK